jgi:hypothetical protein
MKNLELAVIKLPAPTILLLQRVTIFTSVKQQFISISYFSNYNEISMSKLIFIVFALFTITGDKLDPKDKVFLTFRETKGQTNSEPNYALGILRDYVKNKSSLAVVNTVGEADFTFILSVYENGNTNMGKIDIVKAGTDQTIFQSAWTKGRASMYYGYSGVRHAIGTIFNKEILKKYPHIEADNKE